MPRRPCLSAGRGASGAAVAVVGTRAPTRAAANAARQIGYELAQRGFQVISGLALGIDSAAHIGALAQPAARRRRCWAAAS